MSLLRLAAQGLRAHRHRAALSALGVFAAALVVGSCVTVSYAFSTGFARAAERAQLADVTARFDAQDLSSIDERMAPLPNLAARAYRFEANDVELRAGRQSTSEGAVHVLLDGPGTSGLATTGSGVIATSQHANTQGTAGQRFSDNAERPRRGYAIVAGRDLNGRPGEVVIEQGLARTWTLEPGDTLSVGTLGPLRVAGIALSPDNVAFPLARAARVYVEEAEVKRQFGAARLQANLALLWLNDPAAVDATLTQARFAAFGVGGLKFVTRNGVRVLLDQAGGIVIALLVAFSLVSLVAAVTMLAASAHADVQRRLPGIGVQRTLGYSPRSIVAQHAVEATWVAAPAAIFGLLIGALGMRAPTDALLAALNELPPGTSLLAPLAISLVVVVGLFTSAAAWPAWSAASRSPATLLRGPDVVPSQRHRFRRPAALLPSGGFVMLGARFVMARRSRWLAALATVGACAGIALLMLAVASLLERLRDDPGTLGKRYQLTVPAGTEQLTDIRSLPGVQAAAPRYSVRVADSFRLGESLTVIAYPGDHTAFEAPALSAGRRVRKPGEAEVGTGLADVLGLRPGATLAVQSAGGSELRFRVVGVVRALENEGRVAYTQPKRLLAAEPALTPLIAVQLKPGADRADVIARLRALGSPPQDAATAAPRSAAFLGVLASVIRGVGLAVGLVCLYALLQVLAMTVRDRRGAIALLRATGADFKTVALVFAGSALSVAVPAGILAVALERWMFAPLVSRLAAEFAALPLSASVGQAFIVVAALLLFALLATVLGARAAMREPIVPGLRSE